MRFHNTVLFQYFQYHVGTMFFCNKTQSRVHEQTFMECSFVLQSELNNKAPGISWIYKLTA